MLSIISKQTREKTNRQGKRHTRKNKQTTTKKNTKQNKTKKQGQCTHQMELLVTEKSIVSNSQYGWYFFFFLSGFWICARKKIDTKNLSDALALCNY